MLKYISYWPVSFSFGNASVFAQAKDDAVLISKDSITKDKEINPLAPAKAAFYSAIFPGLGQIYNKKYWKIAFSVRRDWHEHVFLRIPTTKNTTNFRNEYKNRLAGNTSPEYSYRFGKVDSGAAILPAKPRFIGMLITCAFYMLNIIDANVDAHLGNST